ncbi:unnamed protein product [Blepharisma stoltei]|uniref:RING-type domain-containing protein n=1 Tax=Blepharisma stoltei TaxID=1481888 RepID=A0AAU9KEY1_9CILI|nr:unnamed protein product [Blepharisma stoltei]
MEAPQEKDQLVPSANNPNSNSNPNENAESDPLLAPQDRGSSRSLVRDAVEEAILRSLNGSRSILTISMLFIFARILTSILILALCDTDTDTPLKTFIIVLIAIDICNIFINGSKHYMYTNPASDGFKRAIGGFSTLLALFYFAWQITGNVWFYSCDDCWDDAVELTTLSLIYIIFGYLHFCWPVLFCCCLCLCIPVLILGLAVFGRGSQTPATKEMLEKLVAEEYDPSKHTGDRTCAICSEEFQISDKVCALPCDGRHIFHENCIKNWLKVNAICPLCRMPLVPENS